MPDGRVLRRVVKVEAWKASTTGGIIALMMRGRFRGDDCGGFGEEVDGGD